LLKYGYSQFTSPFGAPEIIEYCDTADVLKREQYCTPFSLWWKTKGPGSRFIKA